MKTWINETVRRARFSAGIVDERFVVGYADAQAALEREVRGGEVVL